MVRNLTVPGTPTQVGSLIRIDDFSQQSGFTGKPNSQFCGAVGGGRVVVFTDNQSSDMAGKFYATGIDNTTAWDLTGSTVDVLDNATPGVSCAMTYGGITGVTRTFYMVVDNNTSTLLYSIVDNTTTSGLSAGSPAMTVSLLATSATTTPDSLAIDADSSGVPYFAVDEAAVGTQLFRGAAAEALGPVTGISIWGPVDVKVSSDDKQVGVAGDSTDGANTFPAVRVWYNE